MLEQPKRASETVEVLQMKQTGEQSSLMQIAATLGESFELILQWALFWEGAADSDFESTQDTVVIELNTDFNMADMDPALVTAIVAAGMSGYLSKDSIVSRFKRADLIPPERTVEDEISLIDSEAPKLNGATLPTNRPPGAPPGAPPTQKPPAKRGKGNAKPK